MAPLVMFGLVLGTAHLAHADAKGDIAGKSKEAMENYDMMDYGAAKKLLNQALAQAKKAKLDKDPLTAKIYLRLGIAAFADSDPDSALIAFQSAVEIDPKIQIDAAYKSPELQKLLDQAKADAGGGNGGGGGDAGADCTGVKGCSTRSSTPRRAARRRRSSCCSAATSRRRPSSSRTAPRARRTSSR